MPSKRSRAHSLSSADGHGGTGTPSSRAPSLDSKIFHREPAPAVIECALPPHELLEFASFDEYDVHYLQAHVNRCSDCHHNFPDDHFLSLHIAEYHDPINAARRERGEHTYACLLRDCDRMCSTPQKRRLHCIDKHHFPRNYNFIILKDGIDGSTSMLLSPSRQRSTLSAAKGENMHPEHLDDVAHEEEWHGHPGSRRYPARLRGRGGFGHGPAWGRHRAVDQDVSTQSSQPAPATAPVSQDPMDLLSAKIAALKFVPPSVRAARGPGRP